MIDDEGGNVRGGNDEDHGRRENPSVGECKAEFIRIYIISKLFYYR